MATPNYLPDIFPPKTDFHTMETCFSPSAKPFSIVWKHVLPALSPPSVPLCLCVSSQGRALFCRSSRPASSQVCQAAPVPPLPRPFLPSLVVPFPRNVHGHAVGVSLPAAALFWPFSGPGFVRAGPADFPWTARRRALRSVATKRGPQLSSASLPAPRRVSAPHSAFSIPHSAFRPNRCLSPFGPRLVPPHSVVAIACGKLVFC